MWLKPHFYAEIDFTEKTKTGSLRHPVFRGLRKDKSFRAEVLEETPKTKLTHPSKVFWPSKKITKRDLLSYYEEVMEPLLGFAKGAPLTLVRCPSGISSACFYQKHFEKSTDHPKTISIKEKSKTSEYGFLSTPQDVYALVQIGSLELHLWNSRISDLERPQYVVFDLDPGPGVKFSEVTQTAHLIRAILMEKNLESFARTTGGKGLHVVTPLVESDWESSYEFSKEVAELLSSEMPSRYTAQMAKNKRSKKIFIDYLRNQRGSTSVANFSTRAREGALVATPLFWEEVNEKLDPADFNIKSVPRRLKELKEDPWSEFKLT